MTHATVSTATLRARFVERATARFAAQVPDFVVLQALVREQGGVFRTARTPANSRCSFRRSISMCFRRGSPR